MRYELSASISDFENRNSFVIRSRDFYLNLICNLDERVTKEDAGNPFISQ